MNVRSAFIKTQWPKYSVPDKSSGQTAKESSLVNVNNQITCVSICCAKEMVPVNALGYIWYPAIKA